MKLIEIDKKRYRKHLNIVIVSSIVVFAAGSLSISQLLIALFPDPSGSHFNWNLTGVVISAIIVGFVLNKYRGHPFMSEVSYVWDLKQNLNKITRKMAKLKQAAQQGNVSAMTAIQYSYAGSRLLWRLDDNTIVMDQLAIDQLELDELASRFNIELDAEQYNVSLLDEF